MDFGNGGYVLVRLPEVITIEGVATEKIVDVGRETVAKLNQWEKPVLFEHFKVLFAGSSLELLGYSVHSFGDSEHVHVLGLATISSVSDTKVKVSLTLS